MIDCTESSQDITRAIQRALTDEFQQGLLDTQSPYGCGNVSMKIKDILKNIELQNIIKKKFYY